LNGKVQVRVSFSPVRSAGRSEFIVATWSPFCKKPGGFTPFVHKAATVGRAKRLPEPVPPVFGTTNGRGFVMEIPERSWSILYRPP